MGLQSRKSFATKSWGCFAAGAISHVGPGKQHHAVTFCHELLSDIYDGNAS
jgi:hypothetical protein